MNIDIEQFEDLLSSRPLDQQETEALIAIAKSYRDSLKVNQEIINNLPPYEQHPGPTTDIMPPVFCVSEKVPERGTTGAAAVDLESTETTIIHPNETVLVSTNIKMAIPYGYYGQVCSRSGMGVKKRLVVSQGIGVIDSDYRGEIFVPITNFSTATQTVFKGDKIAQMIFLRHENPDLIKVDDIEETERGEGGFGSTDAQPVYDHVEN